MNDDFEDAVRYMRAEADREAETETHGAYFGSRQQGKTEKTRYYHSGTFSNKQQYLTKSLTCGRTGGLCENSAQCFHGVQHCKEGFTLVDPAPSNHWPSGDCWCKPKLDYIDNETGKLVFVHK